jgi:hypothetical protein
MRRVLKRSRHTFSHKEQAHKEHTFAHKEQAHREPAHKEHTFAHKECTFAQKEQAHKEPTHKEPAHGEHTLFAHKENTFAHKYTHDKYTYACNKHNGCDHITDLKYNDIWLREICDNVTINDKNLSCRSIHKGIETTFIHCHSHVIAYVILLSIALTFIVLWWDSHYYMTQTWHLCCKIKRNKYRALVGGGNRVKAHWTYNDLKRYQINNVKFSNDATFIFVSYHLGSVCNQQDFQSTHCYTSN